MAALLPVGPWPADITERLKSTQGAFDVATAGSTQGHAKFRAGFSQSIDFYSSCP